LRQIIVNIQAFGAHLKPKKLKARLYRYKQDLIQIVLALIIITYFGHKL